MDASSDSDVVVGCSTIDDGVTDVSVLVAPASPASSDFDRVTLSEVIGAALSTSCPTEFVATVFVPAQAVTDTTATRLRIERKEITNLTLNFWLLSLRPQ